MKLIFPILLIVLSILTFIVGVNPLYKKVGVLKADIALYNEALNNSTDLQKRQDSLLQDYNAIKQEDKDRLTNFLPNAVNNIQFILEVERIANLHNMPVKNIKFEAMKKNDTPVNANMIVAEVAKDARPYGIFPIEFTTESDYATFVLFLKDLESNLRLVDIKSISFSVPDANIKTVGGANPNIYTYTLKVETYWLK
ncbi:MAG: hypothetical protein WCW54_01270 [Candidatus Paceibacterota bacterium]